MQQRPHVVLICVDQWRGDALGCEGHPVVATPHLDQLAAEGVRFTRAYSATPSCVPARIALYTGLAPETTGRVGYQDGVVWDYPVTIASEFTRHGYQTQAIGKLHVYPERSQIGFQNVILHDGYLHFGRKRTRDIGLIDDYLPWLREKTGDPRVDYFDNGVNCNSQVARPWDKDEALHPSTWIVSEACDFLRRRDPRKPFFLYMGFHRPHPPYDPPAWAFEQYLDAPMPDPPMGDWADEVLGPFDDSWRADPSIARLSPRSYQRARAGYFGHITHIDLLLNRFLETLDEYGERKNTIVCFVSDHGELLGDHGAFRKVLPYDGSARVPLLLSGPGVPRRTVVPDAVAELRDVMPTLLDAAGLPLPDGLDGRSLLPVARGEASGVREWLHGQHTGFGGAVHYLVDARWKYIWWSATDREQLFDLAADPHETRDLSATHPEILALWRARRTDARCTGTCMAPGQRPRCPFGALTSRRDIEAWSPEPRTFLCVGTRCIARVVPWHMTIRRLAVACGLTLLLPGIAHANGAMGLAYSIFPYTTWLIYVAATIVFEAWWIGRALRMPLRKSLGPALAANAVTLVLGIVFSGLFGYLVNGVVSSRLDPNPLGHSIALLVVGGLVSALIEAPFWSTTVQAPFWRSNGHKPPWRTSVTAHLLGVPLALAILLIPERPYRGLESQAEHARNRLVRQDLERALSQSISETERIPAVRTYSELLEHLRPKLTKYSDEPDLWAATYVPHFRRFDTGERRRDPIEWNAAVAGKRIGDLPEPTWLARWIYVDLGGVARPQGIVTEGSGIRQTRDPQDLGYAPG